MFICSWWWVCIIYIYICEYLKENYLNKRSSISIQYKKYKGLSIACRTYYHSTINRNVSYDLTFVQLILVLLKSSSNRHEAILSCMLKLIWEGNFYSFKMHHFLYKMLDIFFLQFKVHRVRCWDKSYCPTCVYNVIHVK